MNGCPACINSQSEWDRMNTQVQGTLTPEDAIAEIESSFVDNFKQMIEPRRRIQLPIKGFPTVLMIRPHSVAEHNMRDANSYIRLLKQNASLKKTQRKRKRVKSKTRGKV
jgi:hypothetical protein